MKTTDKAQVKDPTTSTGTSTTTSQWQTYNPYNAEKGWECPRCGRINAPWVRQCDCSPSTSWDKITINPCDDWDKITINPCWKTKITCDENMFKVHPETVIYTTSVNQVAGGSDYKDSTTGEWVNVPKNHTNSVKR